MTPEGELALLTELQAIRQLLEGSRRPTLRRADRAMLARVLPVVTAVVGSEPFAVRDLFEQDAPALTLVLTGMSIKATAQLFGRAVDQVIDDYVVQHAGRELNVQLWRVLRSI